jgi:two-component system chemotaxis sensor kinase CheA
MLPLTLAIIEGMVIESAKHIFVVPKGQVQEVIRIDNQMVTNVTGRIPYLTLRQDVIPLFLLDQDLGAATKVNVVDSTPGAFIATGVDAIRFNILDTISSNSGGVVMREIDVFGSAVIPEPNSALLIGIAGLTILRRRRA